MDRAMALVTPVRDICRLASSPLWLDELAMIDDSGGRYRTRTYDLVRVKHTRVRTRVDSRGIAE
jgi:hypothetical protein